MAGFPPKPLDERLWKRVVKTDTCWVWTGYKTPNGYGIMGVPTGKYPCDNKYVHRIAYELTYGSIPKGKNVLHKCDNPACCRPDHLFVGTPKDNMDDCIKKGRRASYHSRKNLTIEEVISIKNDQRSQGEIARDFGVHICTVNRIKNGKRWSHI